jgi:acetyl-CoA carboxylase/biotin carboxylase 1
MVRRLGRPALLAATYSSNAAATATAAVEEVQETLETCLTELIRRDSAPGASPADWAHIFLAVLPPLPLHPGKDKAKVCILSSPKPHTHVLPTQ